ncbi:MAG TPA: hypothetical protein VHZ51_24105 [Ktedonobacteraceae bacterium]|jgi:hypothetical protein|nr:hypothetical protein [Ktedonobacteraceae bacterium]
MQIAPRLGSPLHEPLGRNAPSSLPAENCAPTHSNAPPNFQDIDGRSLMWSGFPRKRCPHVYDSGQMCLFQGKKRRGFGAITTSGNSASDLIGQINAFNFQTSSGAGKRAVHLRQRSAAHRRPGNVAAWQRGSVAVGPLAPSSVTTVPTTRWATSPA